MKKRTLWWLVPLLVMTSIAAGCGGGQGAGGAQQVSSAVSPQAGSQGGSQGSPQGNSQQAGGGPVTLKLLQFSTPLTDADFQQLIAAPVKQKYPDITIELIHAPSNFTPEGMIASGDVPDFIYTGSRQISKFIDLSYPLDLNPYVKKYSIDTGAFDPLAIDFVKQYGDHGELTGLPFSIGWSAMFYNKDIFDKFGVPYPTDDMTWDQAVELGQKVARTDGNVVYKPLNAGSFTDFAAPLQIRIVDPVTLKVDINNANFRTAMEEIKKVTSLPGNQDSTGNGQTKFYKDMTMAMEPDYNGLMQLIIDSIRGGSKLNWEVRIFRIGVSSKVEMNSKYIFI